MKIDYLNKLTLYKFKEENQVKKLYLMTVITLLIMTGCGMDQPKTDQEKIAEELNPAQNAREKETPVDPEWDKRLGYVNYTKDQFDAESNRDQIITMDRNEMADAIARIILRNDGFDEIATLVTDKEVLIAYDKNNQLTDEEAQDLAKKSAMSVMPRFFDVHVTDNVSLIPDIQSLHNSTTQESSYKNTLEQIISEMKKQTP